VNMSPRRVLGKAALISGHRIKLRVAVILAGSAAAYITIAPANFWRGELVRMLSESDCNHSHSSDADDMPACTLGATSKYLQQLSDSSAIVANTSGMRITDARGFTE
jgi:hypothetical protein